MITISVILEFNSRGIRKVTTGINFFFKKNSPSHHMH